MLYDILVSSFEAIWTIQARPSFFMEGRKAPEAIHTWSVMLKALRAIHHLALPPILKQGLGDSDFRVLDVLLDKGPMPVNALGPKENLNPGPVRAEVARL